MKQESYEQLTTHEREVNPSETGLQQVLRESKLLTREEEEHLTETVWQLGQEADNLVNKISAQLWETDEAKSPHEQKLREIPVQRHGRLNYLRKSRLRYSAHETRPQLLELLNEECDALPNSSTKTALKTELAKLIETDGQRQVAIKKIVEANTLLVNNIAQKYSKLTHLEPSDLFSEGIIGLINGIEKFNPTFNPDEKYKLSTYATYWIRQAILRSIAERERTVRVPHMVIGHWLKIERFYWKMMLNVKTQNLTLREKAKKIADQIKCPVNRVEEYINFINGESEIVPLDAPISPEPGSATLYNLFSDRGETATGEPQAIVDFFNQTHLEELFSAAGLTPREIQVLRLRFGLHDPTGQANKNEHGKKERQGPERGAALTLQEIGKQLGLSKERVRQIEEEAINKLKTAAQT